MIKVENTTQPPPTQFAAIERNFHETQAGQGLRKSHTPKKDGVRFGVRAISLNCVDLRGPITQKHLYCVEFLRVASRFDSFPKSLSLRSRGRFGFLQDNQKDDAPGYELYTLLWCVIFLSSTISADLKIDRITNKN
jgi:hypothetical protein